MIMIFLFGGGKCTDRFDASFGWLNHTLNLYRVSRPEGIEGSIRSFDSSEFKCLVKLYTIDTCHGLAGVRMNVTTTTKKPE